VSTEFWFCDGGRTSETTAAAARRHEEAGWDGYAVGDNHAFAPDPYPLLGAAAAVTSTLKLGTWVTNAATRNAAVAAASIGAVQTESGGRAYLGIARGDSPLAHLGLAPTSPNEFEHYLRQVQSYLRGEHVDPLTTASGTRAVAADGHNVLPEEGRPTENKMLWIDGSVPKVPVDVAASGPKVIQLAARVADRITFAVSASTERLLWAMDLANQELDAIGRPREDVRFGAVLPIIVAPTREEARQTVGSSVAGFMRFNVMHGTPNGPLSDAARKTLTEVHDKYHMSDHVKIEAEHAQGLPAEVVDDFAIAGPVDYCVERLQALIDIGITKFNITNSAFRSDDPLAGQESHRLLAAEVLPALR
jgi:5,10-methylenetetrahydromethanopterin reductase